MQKARYERKVVGMRAIMLMAAACPIILAGCGKPVPLLVDNDLDGYFISEIYVSSTGSPELGEDLQVADLAPGQTARFTLPAGTYDLQAVDSEDGSYAFTGIVLTGDSVIVSVTEASLDPLTRAARAEEAMAECRANMMSLSVGEALYLASHGTRGTWDDLVVSGIMDNAAEMSCPSDTTASPYGLDVLQDSTDIVSCPADPSLGHGSVVDGVASWL